MRPDTTHIKETTSMEIYENAVKKEEKKETEFPGAAFVAGAVVGLTAVAAIEALIAWAILTLLIGVPLAYLQVLGILLIVNALSVKVRGLL